jgi:uncharacterized RDD family membrane protein YckC
VAELNEAAPGEMQYAGFWSRFVAGLIDFVFFVPVIAVGLWLAGVSYTGTVISALLGPAFLIPYNVGLVAIYGGTVGKLMRGLRVRQVNGTAATWANAWKRSSIDILFSISSAILTLIALSRINPGVYLEASWESQSEMLEATIPALQWLYWASLVWALGEFVTLLSNKKRRALHDFIGGTIVVHSASKSFDPRPGRTDPQQIHVRTY